MGISIWNDGPKKKAVSISINYSWPPGWQSIGASIACQLNRPILAKTLLGWAFHLNTNHWARDGRGVLHGWRVWWEFWQVCTIKSTELSLPVSELTASQKQFLVKCRSLINDHMWIVTSGKLRNVNTSGPKRLQRNRTDRKSPNKPTRPTLWLSSMAPLFKNASVMSWHLTKTYGLKASSVGRAFGVCRLDQCIIFLFFGSECGLWHWDTPLIKGFGQTQKGTSMALRMANTDATLCNLQPQKQNMSTEKGGKLLSVNQTRAKHCSVILKASIRDATNVYSK